MKKRTTEEWINLFKEVHGDKYIYAETDCDNKDEKGRVKIICPKHGEFWMTPRNHKCGQGCRKCMGEKLSLIKRSNKEEFENKANIIHNEKYIYDRVDYINNWTNVMIGCPIHGYFPQTPHNHLSGAGCPECKKITIGLKNKYTQDEFIEECKRVHGNKYIYTKVKYVDIYTPITIICPKHGDFTQSPRDHLQGCGCQKCRSSKMEDGLISFLNDNDVSYEYQKRFKWLGKQSLDFYLKQFNIVIECQGEQHFHPSSFGSKKFNADEMLIYVQDLDTKKRLLCEEHGIKVLYYSNLGIDYPYQVFEDKEELLKEIMKGENI